MRNNKGFTLVEVAVSFALVATISIVLLQLVLSLKEVYLSGDVKTTLLNKQGIMTKNIYDDLNKKTLSSVTSCGLSCLTFTYADGTVKKLLVDPGNKTVKYGDYTLQLDNSSYFGKLSATADITSPALSTGDDSILTIKIPIISKLLNNENFGFNIVKTYNRGTTNVNLNNTIANTDVTLSGINTKLAVVTDENSKIVGIFAKLYRQTKNNYFTGNDFNNFLKNSNANTFSTLASLHAFKTTIGNNIIINEINSNNSITEQQKRSEIQDYQSGYYSLLLNHNDQAFTLNQYYWWYQTSNFASKEEEKGFYSMSAIPRGLTYNKTGNYWASIVGQTTNIGVKSGSIYKAGVEVNSVDLYAEAREYICKYSLSKVTYNSTDIKELTLENGDKMCDY